MQNESKPKSHDIVQVAKSKRHIYLLTKLKESKQSLSPGELKELQKYEKADKPAGVVETMEQVAKAFKVSWRTVANWVKDGMPRNEDGSGGWTYEIPTIWQWKIERGGSLGAGSGSKKSHWETEKIQWAALSAKIKYQKALGELITRQEVEQGRVQRILAVKKALFGLPSRIAPQLVGHDARHVQSILSKRIREIVEDFARGGDGTAGINDITDEQPAGDGFMVGI